MPIFTPDYLIQIGKMILQKAGVTESEAERTIQSLVDANLCGHDSHGIIRILQYIGFLSEGKMVSPAKFEILKETASSLVVDAGWGLGQVQTYRLLPLLETKARETGIAIGTMKKCGHIGRLGEYAEWAAARNLILIASVNSHGCGHRVAPPGGTQGRISTNPICFGVPATENPPILDMGTSACAEGKVRVAYQKGDTIPEGWLIDNEGKSTTDPSVLYHEPRGSILPFGGQQAYKGFGLGLMVDLLSGALSGGNCTNPEFPMPGVGNGVLLILIDVEHFAGKELFLKEADRFLASVRDTPTSPGVDSITLPGDIEHKTKAKRSQDGIAVSDGTWNQILKLAEELGLVVPPPS